MTSGERLRFDKFELRMHDRTLWRDGREVPLRGRAFDVLSALARRPDRTLGTQELLDLAWPGLVVEENNVAAQIVALRKVLGAHAILTVPGRGYKLTARPLAGEPDVPCTNLLAGGAQLFGRNVLMARLAKKLRGSGCLSLVGPRLDSGIHRTKLLDRLGRPGPW